MSARSCLLGIVAIAVAVAGGCGTTPPSTCDAGWIEQAGQCLDPAHRYEPEHALDHDNVVNYGPPLQKLQLPPPPKSGFRLVLTQQVLQPGEEIFYCHAWKLPETVNKYVYHAELHTTPGLHHGNMYATAIDADKGPQPYPACHPGAAAHIGNGISGTLSGDLSQVDVPDILFANTTQLVGHEELTFPDGYAWELRPGREVVMDTHLLNTTDEPLVVEVAYDFYTMPEAKVTHKVAPFVYFWLDFEIPPQAESSLTASCDWFGGEVTTIMPHMHEWARDFGVDFLTSDGEPVASPYPSDAIDGGETQIAVLDPAVDTKEAVNVQFTCTWMNNTDHPMCNGVGENEMCFLFGFMTPPEKQAIGIIPTPGAPCITINGNDPESSDFDMGTYFAALEAEQQSRLLELMEILETQGTGMGGSTCPEKSPGI